MHNNNNDSSNGNVCALTQISSPVKMENLPCQLLHRICTREEQKKNAANEEREKNQQKTNSGENISQRK